jgi:hypothetical protein
MRKKCRKKSSLLTKKGEILSRSSQLGSEIHHIGHVDVSKVRTKELLASIQNNNKKLYLSAILLL